MNRCVGPPTRAAIRWPPVSFTACTMKQGTKAKCTCSSSFAECGTQGDPRQEKLTCRPLDVENRFGQPTIPLMNDFQLVISYGLHFVFQPMAGRIERLTISRGAQPRTGHLHIESRENQSLRIERVKQLVEPVEQQVIVFSLASRQFERHLLPRLDGIKIGHKIGR